MKCPVCNIDLLLSERQGIEIDYCSKCRGVWLDRGELDALIERSRAVSYESPPSQRPYEHREERYHEESHPKGHHGDRRHDEHQGTKGRKRKSFLEDIFDFGD